MCGRFVLSDKKIIKELTDCLKEFNLTELEYTEKDIKVKRIAAGSYKEEFIFEKNNYI